jgi:hypothetical protein
VLAYVFWHWKKINIPTEQYESRQRAFHAALAAEPSAGFIQSFSLALPGAPWALDGGEGYEDWYLVEGFAALGALNETAVSQSRTTPHDRVAAVAAGGSGGVYELRLGSVSVLPKYAHWFHKPDGMKYQELFAELAPVVDQVQAGLWMRQMVLGPAPEFCLHATEPVTLPTAFEAIVIPLRRLWPEPADNSLHPTD